MWLSISFIVLGWYRKETFSWRSQIGNISLQNNLLQNVLLRISMIIFSPIFYGYIEMLACTIPSFNGKPESFPVWMKNANIPPTSQVFYLIGDKVMLSTDIWSSLADKD